MYKNGNAASGIALREKKMFIKLSAGEKSISNDCVFFLCFNLT